MDRSVLCLLIVASFGTACSKRPSTTEFETTRAELATKLHELQEAVEAVELADIGVVGGDDLAKLEKQLQLGIKVASASRGVLIAARKVSSIQADGDLGTCVAHTMSTIAFLEKRLGPIAAHYETDPNDASMTGAVMGLDFEEPVCEFLRDDACKKAIHSYFLPSLHCS